MRVSRGTSNIVQGNCLPMVAEKLRSLASSRRKFRLGMLRVKSDFANQLKAQYPKVFTGVGKVKEFELKLHVDPNVPPVA